MKIMVVEYGTSVVHVHAENAPVSILSVKNPGLRMKTINHIVPLYTMTDGDFFWREGYCESKDIKFVTEKSKITTSSTTTRGS